MAPTGIPSPPVRNEERRRGSIQALGDRSSWSSISSGQTGPCHWSNIGSILTHGIASISAAGLDRAGLWVHGHDHRHGWGDPQPAWREEAMSEGAAVAILLGSIAFVLIVIAVLVRTVGEPAA